VKDRTIVWCLKQKRGIRIIQPNENLTKAYLKKAISALNTMNAALEIKETDWITTTAYYARYFALYALLMKMGIKSEIHDCSIAVARLLTENGILRKDLASDISNSKQARINIQYYVEKELDQACIRKDVENARNFVLELEKVIENVTTDRIEEVRAHMKALKRTL
jgi:uncharacterized protein (UPF0332 family)